MHVLKCAQSFKESKDKSKIIYLNLISTKGTAEN